MGIKADPTLSENLYNMLQEKGWSQTELAYRSGVKISTISNIINMRGGTSLRNLRKIRRVLMCSWEELFD